jgi:hypothetical protein
VTRTRHLLVATAVAASLTLAACGSGSPGDGETPTGTQPAGTASPGSLEAWAGLVCTSLTDVRTALGNVGDGLQVNPLEGSSALDEARTQIRSNLDEVGTQLDELRASIAAAPDIPAAQEAKAAFEASLDDLDAAQQEAADQAQAAASAETPAEFVAAAGGALTAVRSAGTAVGDLFGSATGEGSAEVRAAFDAAPECEGL